MKIAIPTRANAVDEHFGHCEMYTVITADENKNIIENEIIPSASGCGCKSDIAAILQQMGVRTLLAGGIGTGAIQILNSHGIDVVRGCSGNVREVAVRYLSGDLSDSGSSCQHHGHHDGEHTCNH